jgi:hypothetical protein
MVLRRLADNPQTAGDQLARQKWGNSPLRGGHRAVQAVIASVANDQAQAAEQLSARVHAMGDLRQRCAYREMGTALPGLVAASLAYDAAQRLDTTRQLQKLEFLRGRWCADSVTVGSSWSPTDTAGARSRWTPPGSSMFSGSGCDRRAVPPFALTGQDRTIILWRESDLLDGRVVYGAVILTCPHTVEVARAILAAAPRAFIVDHRTLTDTRARSTDCPACRPPPTRTGGQDPRASQHR